MGFTKNDFSNIAKLLVWDDNCEISYKTIYVAKLEWKIFLGKFQKFWTGSRI